MVVVQISEVRLVGGILTAPLYAPVVPAPFGAEPLPFAPCLLHGVVPVPGTEHLPQILCDIPLVAVAHITDDIALQVGGAPLELRAGKHLADDILQALKTVRTDQAYPADTPLSQLIQHLAPPQGAFHGLVEDPQHFPGLVLLHCQDHIKGFRIDTPLPVNLDVHAVDEHHRIIALQGPLQPFRHILAQIIQHPRYARLAVMFPVDVGKHFPDLLLRQPLGVQCPRKTLALFLLIPEYRQYPWMEVAVSVTGYAERQCPTVSVGPARTVPVALVPGKTLLSQIFPAL